MSHRGYFATLALKFSQDAIDALERLTTGPLAERLPHALTYQDIIDLQNLNTQLARSNEWLQEFVSDLQERLSLAEKQNEVLASDILRLQDILQEIERK